MLTGNCIHPELIYQAALCGHGDKILIADGNYPLDSKSGNAKKIYLGLKKGTPQVTDVLDALQNIIRIEKAEVMQPEDGSRPEIFGVFEQKLGGMELTCLQRKEFYDLCSEADVRLAVSTGEERTFANILITVGCA